MGTTTNPLNPTETLDVDGSHAVECMCAQCQEASADEFVEWLTNPVGDDEDELCAATYTDEDDEIVQCVMSSGHTASDLGSHCFPH